MWAADAPEEDDDWIFQEEGPEFSHWAARRVLSSASTAPPIFYSQYSICVLP